MNSCDSDSTTSALSAAQGKSLKTYIDNASQNIWNSLQESYRNNYGKQYNTQVPLLINGNALGSATAQLILEYNNSYIRFRNDGSSFYIMNGNANGWTNYIQFRSTDGHVEFPSSISAPASFQRGFANCSHTAKITSSTHVLFSQAFAGVPKVFVNPLSTVPGTSLLGCCATNVTAQGFDIYLYRTNTGTTGVDWLAVYF